MKDDATNTREALRLTGAMLWLTTRTRVDMSLVSHRSAKNVLNNAALALKIGKRGLRYLRGSVDTGMIYKRGPTGKDEEPSQITRHH